MKPKERYRNAIATQANKVYVVACPYKQCTAATVLQAAHKGDIIRCFNCRKEFKISKVVSR